MTRKLALICALILAVAAVSAGIAIAAAGGDPAMPTAEAPKADDDGATDDDGGPKDNEGSADGESGEGSDDGSGGADDTALTGPDARRASDAALGVTGGGTVVHVEGDDGNTGYEVEVRKQDGSVTEVELDGSFKQEAAESETDD